jgi:hypothetical protein
MTVDPLPGQAFIERFRHFLEDLAKQIAIDPAAGLRAFDLMSQTIAMEFDTAVLGLVEERVKEVRNEVLGSRRGPGVIPD